MRYLPQLLSSVPAELIRDMRDCIPLRVAELLVIVIAAVLVAAIAEAAQLIALLSFPPAPPPPSVPPPRWSHRRLRCV